MSASGITVGTTVDLRKLYLAVDERAARVKDLTPFFRQVVAPAMTALLKQQFQSGGTTMRGGHKWARLAEATVKQKIARGTYEKGTLRDTDWMYDAFTNPDHPDAVEIVNRLRYIRSVQGEAKRIADFHQTGTRFMPARPVMGDGVPTPVMRAWSSQLLRWLDSGRLDGALGGASGGGAR
jgi:hypothetical protein